MMVRSFSALSFATLLVAEGCACSSPHPGHDAGADVMPSATAVTAVTADSGARVLQCVVDDAGNMHDIYGDGGTLIQTGVYEWRPDLVATAVAELFSNSLSPGVRCGKCCLAADFRKGACGTLKCDAPKLDGSAGAWRPSSVGSIIQGYEGDEPVLFVTVYRPKLAEDVGAWLAGGADRVAMWATRTPRSHALGKPVAVALLREKDVTRFVGQCVRPLGGGWNAAFAVLPNIDGHLARLKLNSVTVVGSGIDGVDLLRNPTGQGWPAEGSKTLLRTDVQLYGPRVPSLACWALAPRPAGAVSSCNLRQEGRATSGECTWRLDWASGLTLSFALEPWSGARADGRHRDLLSEFEEVMMQSVPKVSPELRQTGGTATLELPMRKVMP